MRATLAGLITGMLLAVAGLMPRVTVPMAAAALQALPVADPSHPLRWTLTPATGQTYTLAEINASRITVYVGAQADAVLLNPTGPATPVAGVTFTCTASGSAFACVTTQTAGQLMGTTAPGTYRVAVGMEFKQLTGAYAARVVSALCTFAFPVVDSRPSMIPTNVRVAAS